MTDTPLPPQGAQGSPEENPAEFLTREQEFELANRWLKQGDQRARARIVAAYQKLAHAYAARSARAGLPMEDLVQEANIGLLQALDKFEPERGYGFGTFSRYHIISRLQIYLLENLAPVRIFNTAATKILLARYARVKKEVELEIGGPIDELGREVIAGRLEIDLEQVRRYEQATAHPATLDPGAGFSVEEGARTLELLDGAPSPESAAVNRIGREQVRACVQEAMDEHMDAREAEIFSARHLAYPPETLDELSNRHGISRERVRQVEMRARQHVKRVMQQKGVSGAASLFTSE
jgi:RNA polymerase sigma-32 factor